MQLYAYVKWWLKMKLFLILLVTAGLQVSAKGFAQEITLSVKNEKLDKVFKQISAQTGFFFFYNNTQMEISKPVSISVKNESIEQVLVKCFKDQPLIYTIVNKTIVVKNKVEATEEVSAVAGTIRGVVTNDQGEPVAGISVTVKGTNNSTTTNASGEFELDNVGPTDILVITGAETQVKEIPVGNRTFVSVKISARIGELDQVVMMAYGQTTKRLSTGNISKVSGEQIAKQPVSNPLAALAGRVPGLEVVQSNGLAGATFKVRIRGQNSIFQGSDPLVVIDGVPFAQGNSPMSQITTAVSDGLSPLNLINPADIESIEVLKDADATAIYGSRAANGVLLITTKKGKSGKTQVSGNAYTGFSRVTRQMKMLNTQQYLSMRQEAFRNDGIVPTEANAPDLFLMDTTKYTDYTNFLTGHSAKTFDGNINISGGNQHTQFLFGTGYRRETPVVPGAFSDNRITFHLNLNHTTSDKRFSLNLNTIYATDKNSIISIDPSNYLFLAPHMEMYDSLGKLNWKVGNLPFQNIGLVNPMAYTGQKYTGRFDNLSSNLLLAYRVLAGFQLKVSAGYNMLNSDEVSVVPSTAIDPASTSLPYSRFSTAKRANWVIEPQLEYTQNVGRARINAVVGGSWLSNWGNSTTISARDYTSDLLLYNVASAGTTQVSSSNSEYRYGAVFGRVNLNWADKYILNLSGRRDGSSRFGPARRFANFAAAGLAWIFTKESFFEQNLPFISFGKLRGSIGITGNDQIGDYKYLDTWTRSTTTTYQGIPGIRPSQLFNPDFEWEKTVKAEIALDLGFFHDRLLLSASYFRNRSGNQLVSYSLPSQTGFASVLKNLDAMVQNTGLELQVSASVANTAKFTWTAAANVTAARNKLLDFPGLASSSYVNQYSIGQSLSSKKLYLYAGIDPATGIYQVKDLDGNNSYGSADRLFVLNTDPKFYGGLSNTLTYQRFQLDIVLEFKKQIGPNYLFTQGYNVPGYAMINQPVIVLDRWQKPGDNAKVGKYTTLYGSPAFTAASDYVSNSDAAYGDASYIRCKTVSLSYNVTGSWMKKLKLTGCNLYLRGQNLFTITSYEGADPENQNFYKVPPLRTIAIGIQFTF